MFGVSYHWYGRLGETGMRPRTICSRCDQWPKLGNVTIASRPTRSISSTISSMCRIACSVCDRIDAVERAVVEAREAALEVALQHVDAVLHAGEEAGVVDLDAVAVGAALGAQIREQAAVAAAQVEHARAASIQPAIVA